MSLRWHDACAMQRQRPMTHITNVWEDRCCSSTNRGLRADSLCCCEGRDPGSACCWEGRLPPVPSTGRGVGAEAACTGESCKSAWTHTTANPRTRTSHSPCLFCMSKLGTVQLVCNLPNTVSRTCHKPHPCRLRRAGAGRAGAAPGLAGPHTAGTQQGSVSGSSSRAW